MVYGFSPKDSFTIAGPLPLCFSTNFSTLSAGLRAIGHGFALLLGEDDHEKLRLQMPVYDALYAWCRYRLGIA